MACISFLIFTEAKGRPEGPHIKSDSITIWMMSSGFIITAEPPWDNPDIWETSFLWLHFCESEAKYILSKQYMGLITL